jgi:alpha-L-arabinofuranosidase
VRMANIAQLINVLQAMILTDNEKMLTTPTYHTFRLYVPFQDATSLKVTYDAGSFTTDGITLPRADIAAARGTDGKIYLAIVNIDPTEALEVDTSVLGFKANSATGETLAATYNAFNTFDKPNTVSPKPYSAKASGGKLVLKLAPSSVTVVQLN